MITLLFLLFNFFIVSLEG